MRATRRLHGDSPAATRKVIGLCRALRAAGVDAQIVSMGRGSVGRFGVFPPFTQSIDGIPMHVGPMVHLPLVSHLVSMLWLARMAWSLADRRQQQVHLFYNQLTFYLVALVVLRLLRQRTAVDIEDGPVMSFALEGSLAKGRFGANVPPSTFAKFISHGALLANSALAGGTSLEPVMVYYGAIDPKAPRALSQASTISILLSGTLETATGAELLAEALRIVDRSPLAAKISITVTGAGSGEANLRALRANLKDLQLQVLGLVDRDRYDAIIGSSDVGLSLKLMNLSYSDTTFPSKTVEYAENGLLLISTDISDVRLVFGDTAWYLTANDPQQLAGHILKAAEDSVAARVCGLRGQKLVNDQFSFDKAGHRLRAFLFGDAD